MLPASQVDPGLGTGTYQNVLAADAFALWSTQCVPFVPFLKLQGQTDGHHIYLTVPQVL